MTESENIICRVWNEEYDRQYREGSYGIAPGVPAYARAILTTSKRLGIKRERIAKVVKLYEDPLRQDNP